MNDTDPRVGVRSVVRPHSESMTDGSSAEKGRLQGLEEDGAEEGKRTPKKLLDPKLPTQEEIDEHCLTLLPYRNWCRHCVRAKGKAADHAEHRREDGLPEIHFDYCFLGSEDQAKHTVLVAKERNSKMTMSTVVPMKGASEEWAVRRLLAFLKELGLENADVVLKSDQEPAILR